MPDPTTEPDTKKKISRHRRQHWADDVKGLLLFVFIALVFAAIYFGAPLLDKGRVPCVEADCDSTPLLPARLLQLAQPTTSP